MFCSLILRLKEGGTPVLVIIILAILIGWGSSKILHKSDGVIEEACEMIVENQLGLNEGFIDFTPYSPE